MAEKKCRKSKRSQNTQNTPGTRNLAAIELIAQMSDTSSDDVVQKNHKHTTRLTVSLCFFCESCRMFVIFQKKKNLPR